MVGIDSRECERLIVRLAVLGPCAASEDAIVAVVVLDGHAMGLAVYLIGFLGFQAFVRRLCLQQVNIAMIRIMIGEDHAVGGFL